MANEKIYEQFRQNAKEKACPVCGKMFDPVGTKQIYCSRECKLAKKRERRARQRAENTIVVPKNISDNMRAIREMVKDDPSYGKMVARMEGKIK